MKRPLPRLAVVFLLVALLCSCQLFGGSTQVRFQNSTGSVTLQSIQLGSLVDSSPLPPGSLTRYFSAEPGPAVLSAQTPSGTWTNGVLLTLVAGHSYTVTFGLDTSGQLTAGIHADN